MDMRSEGGEEEEEDETLSSCAVSLGLIKASTLDLHHSTCTTLPPSELRRASSVSLSLSSTYSKFAESFRERKESAGRETMLMSSLRYSKRN